MIKTLSITIYSGLILLLKAFIEAQQQQNYIIQSLTTIPNKIYYTIKPFTIEPHKLCDQIIDIQLFLWFTSFIDKF